MSPRPEIYPPFSRMLPRVIMASGWKVLMRRGAPAPTGRAADRPASAEQPSCICRNAPVTGGRLNIKLGWVAAESGWGRNCLGYVGRQRDRYRRVSCRATLRSVAESRIRPDICSVRLHRSPNQIGWAKLLIPAKKWWPPFLGDLS
jgi:hypothetical protein